jgi:hypothetical protein
MEVGKTVSDLLVVGDGKTFDYLIKIKDENPDDYKWMHPYLGEFHVLKNYSIALMKLYGPAGLYDLISLMHKGRTEKCVSDCTDFDKTTLFLLQSWEAVYRLQLELFYKHLEEESSGASACEFSKDIFLRHVSSSMDKWRDINASQENFISSLDSIANELNGLQKEFEIFCHNMCAKNENFRFWHQYVHQDCMAYLTLYLAGRSGNWELRNHALKMMMPLFHVVHSNFYYRLMPRHMYDVLYYPLYISSALKSGGFVMNLTGTPWSSLFLDETHEATINKEIKEVVSSLSAMSLKHKMHYLPPRASIFKHFMSLIFGDKKGTRVAKDTVYFAKLNEENVQAYLSKLKDSVLSKSSVKEFKHIFSEVVAGPTIKDSLLSFRDTGKSRVQEYVRCCITQEFTMRVGKRRPYKFVAIKNFETGKTKVTRKEKSAEQFYKSSAEYYSIIIDWCKRQNIAPDDIEQFVSIPLALATHDGLPIQKQKSDARKYLFKHFKEAFLDSLKSVKPTTLIVDAMVLVYKYRPSGNDARFETYASKLFDKCVTDNFRKGYSCVHFVFDRQEGDIETPKSVLREMRDANGDKRNDSNVYISIGDDTHTPFSWNKFLTSRSNKKNLIQYICDFFVKIGKKRLAPGNILYIGDGCGRMKVVTRSDVEADCDSLVADCNNHVEGDTMVLLHATKYANHSSPVVIQSTDTDIIHVALPLVKKYKDLHLILHVTESVTLNMYIDLKRLIESLARCSDFQNFEKEYIPRELQALYVCSGCDYVSFFSHNSKTSFYDSYFDNVSFISSDPNLSGMLCHMDGEHYSEGFHAFCRLVACIFLKKCSQSFEYVMKFKKKPTPREIYARISQEKPNCSEDDILKEFLNQIREYTKRCKGCHTEDFWLPSLDSLMYHWKRCCYVVQVWNQADKNIISYPDITHWGWSYVGDKLCFMWDSHTNLNRVEKVRQLWTSGCKCKSVLRRCASKVCGCRKLAKSCGPACLCVDACQNKPQDPSVAGLLSEMIGDEDNQIESRYVVAESNVLTDDEVIIDEDSDIEC